MGRITSRAVAADSLLDGYKQQNAYTDCYTTTINGVVTLPQYVEAFYTTWLFKTERLILKWVVNRPSTDAQAAELARGGRQDFAAWTVEDRRDNEILLCDYSGRTRSWLRVEAAPGEDPQKTRLFFGSAVVPLGSRRSGQPVMGFGFSALLGFHRVYSRSLLHAARQRLQARLPR